MTFTKYNVRDDGFSTLASGITASQSIITVATGTGGKFPTNNAILTLVQYTTPTDPLTDVIQKERVLVTNRTGETLTVTRGFGGDTQLPFSAGDTIGLFVVAEVTTDIQDAIQNNISSINTINNGRTISGETHKVIYTNGSAQEQFVALGANGTVLQSTGPTSAPNFVSPTVNIAGLPSTTDANGNIVIEQTGINRKLDISLLQSLYTTTGIATQTIQNGDYVQVANDTFYSFSEIFATSSSSNSTPDIYSNALTFTEGYGQQISVPYATNRIDVYFVGATGVRNIILLNSSLQVVTSQSHSLDSMTTGATITNININAGTYYVFLERTSGGIIFKQGSGNQGVTRSGSVYTTGQTSISIGYKLYYTTPRFEVFDATKDCVGRAITTANSGQNILINNTDKSLHINLERVRFSHPLLSGIRPNPLPNKTINLLYADAGTLNDDSNHTLVGGRNLVLLRTTSPGSSSAVEQTINLTNNNLFISMDRKNYGSGASTANATVVIRL